ncbi:hypothetical protein C499_14260 [Halogeometricum borinquense DSM 11551]|uniref:Protein gvpI n=1 Tax=Halogeometricum borinquense (strain ATCC 700274 / DSM 11551 / JCM 10706 / KCTC 4070 / PR3) TaxID=469382 RepID=E4NUR4_HALBP|nr:hypothetical protein [Halogeometricum borinquense]ADQ68784.1 hypothetical protein Hbor_32530 [Halogeometricum borinquense DSM 11551]ELY25653.1 hypothetical protein C499_14260 [Halogeometricum borinquense DSM 11551]
MTDKQQQKRKQKARQILAKAQLSRDTARQKLLQQRRKIAQRRKRNRHQSESQRDRDENDGTGNPTAHSTLPPQKSNAENAARNSHSTVPAVPKHSNVAARERLYGQRLHRRASAHKGGNVDADHPSETDSDRRETSSDE